MRHHVAAATVFLLSLLLTVAVAWRHLEANEDRLQEAMQSEAQRVSALVARRLDLYTFGLRGLRGAVQAVGWEGYTRNAHHRYFRSRSLDQEFPGARGVGLIRRIELGEEAEFLAQARRDGWPEFRVRYLNPNPDARFVIQYIEPIARNREAVGLDIASERNRRLAALRAARTGDASLTGPITLVQATGQPGAGFLLLLPVYPNTFEGTDEADRERAVLGWTYTPLLVSEVLADLDFDKNALQLTLADVHEGGAETFFTSAAPDGPILPIATSTVDRPVAGRIWRVRLQATPALARTLGLVDPRLTLLIGTLLSALLAIVTATSMRVRREARALMREKERRAAIAQSITDAVMIVDTEGRVRDWNPGGAAMFGYAPAEIIGRNAVDVLVPPDLVDEAKSAFSSSLQGSSGATFETQRLHRDGSRIDVSVVRVPLRSQDGRIDGVAVSMRDIRANKAAEREIRQAYGELERRVEERTRELHAALRESESLLRAVFSHAIVSVSDRDGRIVEVNEAFCRISGYRRDELIGQNHRVFSSGWHTPAFWAAVRQTIEAGHPWRGEVCNRARDGSLFWVDSMIAPILGADEQVDRYISIRFDITEAKAVQSKLQAREDLLERTGHAAHVGGWELDLPSNTLTWTHEVFRILDLPLEFVPTPDNALEFYDVEYRPKVLEVMQRAIRVREDWDIEVPMVTAKGRRITVRLTGTALVDAGRVVRLYGATQDISEKKAFERGLQEARLRAESANRAKSEFLANMSHEIRTPLNAVQGLVYLLRQTALDAQQVRLLDRIHLGGGALLQIINDVLDLSKVEAGEMGLERMPFDLARVTREAVALIEVQAQAKDLPVRLELADSLPAQVHGDPTRFGQIVTNLLSNAIKFTQHGHVGVQLAWVASGDGRGTARLTVSDTGIGMSEETAARVFQPFVQADNSTTRRFGGTGLGLAIVKRLLELMNGRIDVHSVLGQGSRFEVSVDFDLAHGREKPRSFDARLRADMLAGRTLLVVDDSDINRDVAQRILEHRGATVLLADNGARALEVLRVRSDIDGVLLDLHMPVMDGFEAASRIRVELQRTDLPVIALTAGATLTERNAAEAAGCDAFLTKPLDPARLLVTIDQLLRTDIGPGEPDDASQPDARRADNTGANGASGAPSAPAAAPAFGAPTRAAGQPVGSGDWPSVEGVDIAAARERLCDDLPLFQRMVSRFFAQGPRAEIERAHAIRGNAGTLGMTRAHLLAGRLEEALKIGDEPAARASAQSLEAEWLRLQAAFAPWLAAAAANASAQSHAADPQPQEPVGPDQLDELCRLLERFNPRAIKYFERLAPGLADVLKAGELDALREDMRALRFRPAMQRLRAARERLPANLEKP